MDWKRMKSAWQGVVGYIHTCMHAWIHRIPSSCMKDEERWGEMGRGGSTTLFPPFSPISKMPHRAFLRLCAWLDRTDLGVALGGLRGCARCLVPVVHYIDEY